MVVTGSDHAEIQLLKDYLHGEFTIKDLGCLHYFLGLEITYVPEGISQELLQENGLTNAKTISTPLPLYIKLTSDQGDLLSDPTHYRSLIEKLNFLTNTRPDLSFSIQLLSQFMQSPTSAHLDALHHVLRYVRGTIGQGILLNGNTDLSLHAYSDSDWATCPMTRRSVTGYIVLFGGLLSVGSPRNNPPFPNLPLKLNTKPCPMLL